MALLAFANAASARSSRFADPHYSGPMSEMNTTPLIDVLLVLLIMFIIAIPLANHSLVVNVPGGENLTIPRPDPVINKVTIDEGGTIYWNAAPLDQRVGLEFYFFAEAALRGLRRHIQALSLDVVFPAVVGAADAAFFIAAKPERDAAVRAKLVDHTELPLRIAKGEHLFTQQLKAHRRPVGYRHLFGQQCRQPVTAEQTAHGRACAGLREKVVLFFFQHGSFSGRFRNSIGFGFGFAYGFAFKSRILFRIKEHCSHIRNDDSIPNH